MVQIMKYLLAACLHGLVIGFGSGATIPEAEDKPPIGTWTVTDENNNVCMRMQMGVRFTIPFTNTSNQDDIAVIDAPLTAHPVGNCNANEREFTLHLFNDGVIKLFYVYLTFKSSSSYRMTEIGSLYTVEGRRFKNPASFGQQWQSTSSDNYLNNSISLDKSFTCGHNLPFPGTLVTLYDVKFMPFADRTQGEFGESVECRNAQPASSAPAVLVIIAFIVVIALSVVGCVFGYRKYQQSRA